MGHLVNPETRQKILMARQKCVLSYTHMICLNSYNYLDSTVNFPMPLYQLPSFLLFTPNHPIRHKMYPVKRVFLFPRIRQNT